MSHQKTKYNNTSTTLADVPKPEACFCQAAFVCVGVGEVDGVRVTTTVPEVVSTGVVAVAVEVVGEPVVGEPVVGELPGELWLGGGAVEAGGDDTDGLDGVVGAAEDDASFMIVN